MNSIPTEVNQIFVDINDKNISVLKLLKLDFRLFLSLLNMGAAPDKICKVLRLTIDEYESLCWLAERQ